MRRLMRVCLSITLVGVLCATDVLAQDQQRRQAQERSQQQRRTRRRATPRNTSAAGTLGAAATGSPVAADAAIDILKRGGNAADAAVAALLVQTVLESGSFCFGGEVPILVYDARRDLVEVVAGQGVAPRLATEEFYNKNREGVIRGRGDVATAAVPGALDAFITLLDRYGTITFSEAAAPMVDVLSKGSREWYPRLANVISRLRDVEKQGANDRRRGLRLVADYFYRGPIARELDAWSRENGGLIRFCDLATHVTRIEDPVSIEYKGYTVYKCGVWTQGPALLQSLRILEGMNLETLGHNSPDYIHTVAEAMKLAFADRDTYYADPLFEEVPTAQLLSKSYASVRRSLIDMSKASVVQRPGDPRKGKALLGTEPRNYKSSRPMDDDDTTTCIVADRWGNVVSATPSGWGGVMAGKTGIQLGSRLISLNVWGDHPNTVVPGKRPRITLTPTLVFKDGKPVFAVSVAGGDLQDQTTLQILLNHIDFGFDPDEAVSAPRFSTRHMWNSFGQTKPRLGSLSLDSRLPEDVVENLASRGHDTSRSRGAIGAPVVMKLDPQGRKHASGDPRSRRSAAAYSPNETIRAQIAQPPEQQQQGQKIKPRGN